MKNNDITANLPRFSQIKVDQIEPELTAILDNNLQEINQLIAQTQPFTWQNLMQPLEDLDDRLSNMWSPVSHMHAVVNSSPLRKTYEACIPKLSDYGTNLSHNQKLYEAISSIKKTSEFENLDRAQRKIIENELRDFKLAGVALPQDKKKRFAEIVKELAQLTTKFENNVLDATQGWQKHITDASELKGIPDGAVHAAAELAKKHNKEGWIFTLEFPSYFAVITYADSAKLREEIYCAYTTRASDQGPNANKWDNSQIMLDILKRRLEVVQLLDFHNYAERSLVTKMVKKPKDVLAFLQELVTASLSKAKQEYTELCDFAKTEFNVAQLNSWDIPYYSEKLRQHRYDISQEDLRPYFPEDRVVNGLFAIVNKLFKITIKELKEVDTWHPDARCFAIYDKNEQLCAQFYLDLYARENKRGGAWMDECRVRRRLDNGNIQIPVAYVTANLNPPIGNEPALFKHDEVVTLFHEFGHALQHMLTTINYADVSGINGVPWDAVEIASQFLENWAWEKEPITLISEHYQTKEPLPDELFEKMHRAKNFQAAMQMMRQLEFSLFDFHLHMEFDPKKQDQIQTILNEVRSQVGVIPVPEFNRFQNSFSHIFAGGYAAGYYSYKWAEVMAADAFSLFKQKGIFNNSISKKFLHTFLESGGAVDPMELFIEFRGRKPQIEALLKQSGIK